MKSFDQTVDLELPTYIGDFSNTEKASGVTKYTWDNDKFPGFIHFGSFDRAEWGVKGDMVVLDNGSATLTLATYCRSEFHRCLN